MYGVLNWASVTSSENKITQSNIGALIKSLTLKSGGFLFGRLKYFPYIRVLTKTKQIWQKLSNLILRQELQ